MATQPSQDAMQSAGVWYADHNDVGYAWIWKIQRCHVEHGVGRLDYLLSEWKVLPDENVNVAVVDLCHDPQS